jgi:hypothetical protein
MPLNPPDYGESVYWDKKYANSSDPFDWLLPASSLDNEIFAALNSCPHPDPKILHIGCGTSLLSFSLRNAVQNPAQVHNLDFSAHAIEWGRQIEHRLAKMEVDQGVVKGERMTWTQTSLLSLDSVRQDCDFGYSIVVEKSCSDAISCSDDIKVGIPYPLYLESSNNTDDDLNLAVSTSNSGFSVHPLHVLALNLALVSLTGSIWIALSYSQDRFHFL